jgi:hypothetical protein
VQDQKQTKRVKLKKSKSKSKGLISENVTRLLKKVGGKKVIRTRRIKHKSFMGVEF